MKVVYVIPTFNRKNYLCTLLNQILIQNVDDVSFEVIVVVDGSRDGTNEMLKTDFPTVKVVQGTGDWWFTKSLNEGCKQAIKLSPDYIITMNDDTEIENDYLKKLLAVKKSITADFLLGSISVSLSKPQYVTFSGVKKIIWWRMKRKYYMPSFSLYDRNKFQGVYKTESLMTRGLLIPTRILLAINFFDEDFVQYGSDEDFCLRAIKKGYHAFISWDAIVYENVHLTSKGTAYNNPSFKEFYSSIWNRYSVNSVYKHIKFYMRHGTPIFLPLYLIIIIIGSLKAQIWNYRKLYIS